MEPALDISASQIELFRLYAVLFTALGIAAPAIAAVVGYGKEKAGKLVEKIRCWHLGGRSAPMFVM